MAIAIEVVVLELISIPSKCISASQITLPIKRGIKRNIPATAERINKNITNQLPRAENRVPRTNHLVMF